MKTIKNIGTVQTIDQGLRWLEGIKTRMDQISEAMMKCIVAIETNQLADYYQEWDDLLDEKSYVEAQMTIIAGIERVRV